MSIKRISLFLLLVLSIVTAILVGFGRSYQIPEEPPPAPVAKPNPEPKPTPEPPKAALPTPPNTAAAVGAAPAPPPSAPQPEEDEEATEAEQVAAARQQLASSDPAQRVEGAEQLGAYPTKEAEDLLVQALASDTSAEVRSAAAQSLGYVEKPSDHTLSALLSALEDQDEDVRNSALSTLEDFLTASDEGSRRYQGILAGLRAKAAARSVPPDVREAINDILQEQSDTATP